MDTEYICYRQERTGIMEKLNVAVFFGGCSSEYGVSLESASAVISNLDKDKYRPVPVGITKDGDWYYFKGDPAKIPADTWCGLTAGKNITILSRKFCAWAMTGSSSA